MKTTISFSLDDGLELDLTIAHSPLDSEGLDMNIMSAVEKDSRTPFDVSNLTYKEKEDVYEKLCRYLEAEAEMSRFARFDRGGSDE